MDLENGIMKHLGIFLLVFALISCNEDKIPFDEDVQIQTEDEDIPSETEMDFNVSIDASKYGAFRHGDSMGLFLKSDRNEEINNNIKITLTPEAEWVPEKALMVQHSMMTAYSYFPYNPQCTSLTKVDVVGGTDINYMYSHASFKVNDAYRLLDFNMKPALARMIVKIKKYNLPEDMKLESICIRSVNGELPMEGELNLSNGVITHTKTGVYSKKEINQIITEDYDIDDIYFNMIPVSFGSRAKLPSIELVVVINGKEYITQLKPNDHYLQQGNISIINIIYNGVFVSVDNIMIKPWNQEDILLDGDVEIE